MRHLNKIVLFVCCLLVAGTSSAQKKTVKPVLIIFDSDMGPDYDDVGAIALLHALADSGHVKILATIASTKYDGVACVMNVFNTYFNRPNTPIAVPKITLEFIANAALIAEEGGRLGVVITTIMIYAKIVTTPKTIPFANAFLALLLRVEDVINL